MNDKVDVAELIRQIELIKAVVPGMTAGPWKSFVEGRDAMSGESFILTKGEDIYVTGATKYDQDFFVLARNVILDLILEYERLRSVQDSDTP
jgi:hypothetical protein